MGRLLALVSAVFLIVPELAFAAGNPRPELSLEIYAFMDEPNPVPEYLRTCAGPPFHCWVAKQPSWLACMPIHVDNVPNGFYAVNFGIMSTGERCVFYATLACPGFINGPSTAGWPSAMNIFSLRGCRDWAAHPGYVEYYNPSNRTGSTIFAIVPSADAGNNYVINCDRLPDVGTVVEGDAQWGGSQTIACFARPTGLALTTWGNVKTLFR